MSKQISKIYHAAIYVRLSKEDGDVSTSAKAESNSISNQKDFIRNFLADKKDIRIVKEYVDDGYSGSNFDRPSFQTMMEDIKRGVIDCVVVKDLSRFGREYIDSGRYIERLFPALGVRFIAINDNYDSVTGKSQGDEIIIPFKNLINDAYCRDISIKIRSHLDVKRKNGEYIGAFVPYGYEKSDDDKHKLVIDTYAAGIVKEIFRLKLHGMSQDAIATQLNNEGVLAPMEYKQSTGSGYQTGFLQNEKSVWSSVTVRRILENEISTYVPKDEWIVIENCHEPIITQKLFDTAHANSKKYIRPKRGKRNYNPFYYCGVCGRALVPSKRVKGDILLCSSSRIEENSPCKSNRVEIAKVEDTIMKIVNMYATAYLDEKGIKKAGKSKEVSPEEKIATLEKKVKSLSSKKMMLYSDYKDDKLTREEYVKRSKAMVEQIDELHQEIEQLKTEIPPEDNSSSKFETQLESIINMESFDREKIQKVIKKVIINGEDNIEIVWNTDDPFFK